VTKAKLIQAIAQKTGLTKLETQAVLTGFWDTVIESLAQGESVELRGFGSFRVQHRPPRKARNPATGESIQVDARRVPVFKPAREFKDQVNQPLDE